MSRTERGIRWALLALALSLLGIGIWRGGYWDVLRKACVICIECMGIG